jgi:hypothetical protein
MTKLLFVNPTADALTGQVSGSHWQLPDEVDLSTLRGQIEQAVAEHGAVSLSVLLPGGQGQTASLTLNAAALLAVALVEVGPPAAAARDDRPGGVAEEGAAG